MHFSLPSQPNVYSRVFSQTLTAQQKVVQLIMSGRCVNGFLSWDQREFKYCEFLVACKRALMLNRDKLGLPFDPISVRPYDLCNRQCDLSRSKTEFRKLLCRTLLTGVKVMSWSKNCPNCISINVYLPWRWDTSACTTTETNLGEGKAFPLKERKRGLEMAESKQSTLVHVTFL